MAYYRNWKKKRNWVGVCKNKGEKWMAIGENVES